MLNVSAHSCRNIMFGFFEIWEDDFSLKKILITCYYISVIITMHIFFVGTEGMLLAGIFVTVPHAKYSMAGVKYLQISKHKQKYFRALTIRESLQNCNPHSSQRWKLDNLFCLSFQYNNPLKPLLFDLIDQKNKYFVQLNVDVSLFYNFALQCHHNN